MRAIGRHAHRLRPRHAAGYARDDGRLAGGRLVPVEIGRNPDDGVAKWKAKAVRKDASNRHRRAVNDEVGPDSAGAAAEQFTPEPLGNQHVRGRIARVIGRERAAEDRTRAEHADEAR